METTYYYFTPANERQGPFSVQQLRGLKDAGKIPESASVLSSANGKWHLLVDVLNGDHPYSMRRRHALGKCPRCHNEVETITEASYENCSHCGFPLGTPRSVAGIRKNFLYTLRHRYFCMRGRAVKTEYWSFMAMFGFITLVTAIGLFVISLVFVEEFNMHALDNRSLVDLLREEQELRIWFYIVSGIIGAMGLFCFIPLCGLTMRRLRDIGRSGLWFMFALLPGLLLLVVNAAKFLHLEQPVWEDLSGIVNHPGYLCYMVVAIALLMFVLPNKDSQPGPNKYGPSPKYPRY